MAYSVYIVIASVVAGATGFHLDPDCPRHRRLPDGFSSTENKIRGRALFTLDLRSAVKGFFPEKEYRFRVQTTARIFKFNDATVVIDPVDDSCGAGSLVTDTHKLYSSDGCSSIVTTQQKQPMGRAYFKWIAPPCGCVHFRVRVHANATYYIEDEDVRNGPLSKTICPKAGTVKKTAVDAPTTQVAELPELLTRNERLQLLCDVTEEHKVEDVMRNEDFMSKRTMSKLSSFELERLHIAVERRHLEVLNCCNLNTERDKSECFGDIRRIRIDTLCGSGEPDIPLTNDRYDWIKQKQSECCPQIGEARYRCFNHTLHDETMMKDGHGHHTYMNMDDFDPVSYVEDYPHAEEIRTKFMKERKQMTKVDKRPENAKSRQKVQYKTVKDTEVVKTQNTVTGVNTDNDGDGKDNGEQGQVHKEREENAKSEARDSDDIDHKDNDLDDKDDLTDEKCCMNGIDAGTRVVADGFDGCFKMADTFNLFFTKWNQQCDRHFVICCMRVIDGDYQEVPRFLDLRKLLLPRKHACSHEALSTVVFDTHSYTRHPI